ncbi:MAG: M20/M25/M40 family metallo-hydrolase [Acidobacteria bacterium]|nr:M20/M25/M40 family metallo-hydrolase [Acidobacteriota bacterium]
MMYRSAIAALLSFVLPASSFAAEAVDLNAVYKIKNEAFENSKVMDHLFYLTDVYGPRLTNSANHKAAAEWAVKQLQSMGLKNARLEKWGPFGKSWNNTHFAAHMIEPSYMPIIGFPQAWTPGTNGTVTAEPVMVSIKTEADMEKYKGKLKGKLVMDMPIKDLQMATAPLARRYTDVDLNNESLAPDPSRMGGRGGAPSAVGAPGTPPGPGGEVSAMGSFMAMRQLRQKVNKFFADEGAVAVMNYGAKGDGGTVFATAGGSRNEKDPVPPPMFTVTPEHYNRIARLVEKKIPVKMEVNIKSEFVDAVDGFNVIAEIPGTDKADEIVMVGAHLDSWHGATGATDNAAGCASAMEAIRLLMASGVKPRRTIRIALWGGEEQGLLGSRAYVKEHFADRETMKVTEQHAKFSGYFNLDNGTGKIRGVYAQGNDMMRPVFAEWLKPLEDLGATAVTNRNTGGTDHQSFDAVGLPGFQFIQDPIEYSTRTHHSNMDVYDHVQKGDLMQASAVIATFLVNTANRDELLPRKPLPKPRPAGPAGGPPF